MPTTPIDELARLLRESRARRGFERKRVADMAGCSVTLIEEWENGKAVPDNSRWARLVNMFDRTLRIHEPLHRRALEQQSADDAARLAEAARQRGQRVEAKTNLGAKLMLVTPLMKPSPAEPVKPEQPLEPEPEPAPEPARDARRSHRADPDNPNKRPYPSNRALPEAALERREWVRAQFVLRPNAPIAGRDGILALCRERFGIALDTAAAAKIKAEVNAKQAAERTPRVEAPKVKAKAPSNSREAIEAGVQLIMEAIPNLAALTIDVDEYGAAQVDFKVREVKVVETIVETKGAFALKGRS